MAYSEARKQDKAALRDIKVKVRYAPEKFAPVDDIPVGTTRELLLWVNYSPLRAQRVLAREITSRTPRIKLIRTLYNFLQSQQEEQAITARSADKMAE